MILLKAIRERSGLSQRVFAKKAGIAYKTLQLLESGGHNPRWSTLAKIAVALKIRDREITGLLGPAKRAEADTAHSASLNILTGGENSWKLWLFNFVDAFRKSPHYRLVASEPDPRTSQRVQALLAATVETLCAKKRITPPWWTRGIPPLGEPWFTAETENLKATALLESPAAFRQKNIFVLSNFLSRA